MSLPEGTVVRLNRRTRVHAGGRILVGGSPTRLVRLGEPARELLKSEGMTVVPGGASMLADRLVELGLADPQLDSLPPVPLDQLTVVIPVRNRPGQLRRLLHGLPESLQVVVVDDASADPRAIEEVATANGARLERHSVNGGPAAARNTGLRQVTTPFVAFLDSDVVADREALSLLLRHFHDTRVAVVAPRVSGLPSSSTDSWIVRYEAARSSLDLGPDPGLVRPRARVAWVPSACVIARTSALADGFDESMRVGEDVDLIWRLVASGHRIRYEPSVSVRHEHRVDLRGFLTRKAFYGTSAHDLAQRHGGNVAPAVLAPWSTVLVVALLSQRRWGPPVAAVAWATAVVRLASRTGGVTSLPLATELATHGAATSLEQGSALLLRHWWPLALLGSVRSRRVRRAVVTAGLLDGAIEWRRTRPDLDPVRFLVARRLDDLAYGAGVWFAAWRGRSLSALVPDVSGRADRSGPSRDRGPAD